MSFNSASTVPAGSLANAASVAGPAVVDGEIPTDEWRSGSMVDFFRVGDVDEVEFRAERSRAFAAQQPEQSGSPRAENLGNADQPWGG